MGLGPGRGGEGEGRMRLADEMMGLHCSVFKGLSIGILTMVCLAMGIRSLIPIWYKASTAGTSLGKPGQAKQRQTTQGEAKQSEAQQH